MRAASGSLRPSPRLAAPTPDTSGRGDAKGSSSLLLCSVPLRLRGYARLGDFERKRGSGAPVTINVHQRYLEDG